MNSQFPDHKDEFRQFCQRTPELPVFLHDWWLDLVCGSDNWEVAVSRKNNQIIGVLPYHIKRYWGLSTIVMPVLCPYGGAWIEYPTPVMTSKAKMKTEREVYRDLLSQIPKVDYYAQRHTVQLQNWLPFHWKGYQQETLYTYRLPSPIHLEEVRHSLAPDVRNKIRKAKGLLQVKTSENIEKFYAINRLSFQRQQLEPPYSLRLLRQIDQVLAEKSQREILLAEDRSGQCHAAVYLVWDGTVMYNLMLGADTKLRASGAVQLLLWEAIRFAQTKNLTFDFEGSRMQKVEKIFRGFGATIVPYSKIYKPRNKWIELMNAFRAMRM